MSSIQPLAGCVVLDVSTMVAGPYAAMLLGDLGAAVIKVEQPTGDPARELGAHRVGEDSGAFHSVNRNKRNVILDLRSDEGRQGFRELAATADVVVHNSLPGHAAKLHIDGASLLEEFPELVVVEVGGFGRRGNDANRPAYDIIVAAMSGLMSVTGEERGRPLRPGAPMIDVSTGVYAALGAVSAVLQRHSTGRGQIVSVNMIDVAVNLQTTNFSHHFATGSQPARMANGSYFAISNCFATADSWVAVAVGNDRLWKRLVEAIGDSDLARPEYRRNETRLQSATDIEEALAARFAERSTAQWLGTLDKHGVPCAPILDYADVLTYLEDNKHSTMWQLERGDTGPFTVIGNPIEFSDARTGVPLAPPRLDRETSTRKTDLDR